MYICINDKFAVMAGEQALYAIQNILRVRKSTLSTAFYCQPIASNDISTRSGFPDDSLFLVMRCACVVLPLYNSPIRFIYISFQSL